MRKSTRYLIKSGLCASLLFLASATLFAQNNPTAAYTYANSMLASPSGQAMVANIEAIPNPENPLSADAHTAAVNYVRTYYVNMYYQNNIPIIPPDSTDDHSACFNGNFLLSSQSDNRLIGYRLWDGTRRGINQCDIQFNSSQSTPFVELPDHVYPNTTDPLFQFNLNPDDDGSYAALNTLGFDPSQASFNTFNLILNEPDPVLPALLGSRPPTGARSIRINNQNVRFHINKMSRTFQVTAANAIYYYSSAFVLENPTGHVNLQPLFVARILDNTGTVVREHCTVSSPDNPNTEYVKSGGRFYNYKRWSCEQFDLTPWIGQEVTVEFIAADCGAGEHYGYAYVADICTACGGAPDIFIKAIEEKCAPNQVVVSGKLKLPAGYTFVGLNLEFYNAGIRRSVVPVTTYNIAGGSFERNLDPAFLSTLSPAGGYDVYAAMTYINPAGDTLTLRSLSAVANTTMPNPNPLLPPVILTDNDLNTTHLLSDVYPPCPVATVMGGMGMPVRCVYSNGLNHEIYRAELEFDISSLASDGWTLDHLANFDSLHNNITLTLQGGYFTNTYAFMNASGKLQINGYFHITDPMQIGQYLLNIYGTIKIKNECSKCDLNFAVWDIIGCRGAGLNCENMTGSNTSLASYMRTIRNERNEITNVLYGIPVYLPFIAQGKCNITTWTITARWIDYNNVGHPLPAATFNIPLTAPFEILDYVQYNLTAAEWQQLSRIELTFTNNCDQSCTTFVGRYSYMNSLLAVEVPVSGAALKLELSPNPAKGWFKVNIDGKPESGTLEIMDVLGHKIVRTKTEAGDHMEFRFDAGAWVPGVYIVRFVSQKGIISEKIIVAH